MASSAPKSNPAATLIGIVVGAVLMAGGVFISNQIHHAAHEASEKAKATGAAVDYSGVPFGYGFFAEKGIAINLGETIATIGVLLILFPVVRSFFISPLIAAITERNTKLEETFADAESLRAEMKTVRADYEARLQATEADARERIQAEVRAAQQLGATLKAEAADQADRMKAAASAEIEAERQRVLGELRGKTADLALTAASKVVRENMDDARNRRLVDEFIADLEVAR